MFEDGKNLPKSDDSGDGDPQWEKPKHLENRGGKIHITILIVMIIVMIDGDVSVSVS